MEGDYVGEEFTSSSNSKALLNNLLSEHAVVTVNRLGGWTVWMCGYDGAGKKLLPLLPQAPQVPVRVCRTPVPPRELQNPVSSCCAYGSGLRSKTGLRLLHSPGKHSLRESLSLF